MLEELRVLRVLTLSGQGQDTQVQPAFEVGGIVAASAHRNQSSDSVMTPG
jgi:hypothetical protein